MHVSLENNWLLVVLQEIGRLLIPQSCFSEIALLIRLFRLIRLDVSGNVCIQFLVQNAKAELGFRTYLLYTFEYWYLIHCKKW